jgi:hypothetical protein
MSEREIIKGYKGDFKPFENFEIAEVAVSVDCPCGNSFWVYPGDDEYHRCLECKRVYQARLSVLVDESGAAA